METLNSPLIDCGTLFNILTTLQGMAAAADLRCPDHLKGVRIHFENRTVTFISGVYGRTVKVKLISEEPLRDGTVLLSHEEIADLILALAQRPEHPVTLVIDRQPLTHSLALVVQVGNWYTAHIGHYRAGGWPLKSHGHIRDMRQLHVAIGQAAHGLKPLSVDDNFRTKLDNDKETVLTVLNPIPGVISVKTYLY